VSLWTGRTVVRDCNATLSCCNGSLFHCDGKPVCASVSVEDEDGDAQSTGVLEDEEVEGGEKESRDLGYWWRIRTMIGSFGGLVAAPG
jgi:hypothetical protein